MSTATLDPYISLISALLGVAVGGFIAYRSALGLKKREEGLMREAVRRQLRDLLGDVRSRFTALKANQLAPFVRDDPAIGVLLERGFSTDSARSLKPEEGRLVQTAILRSVRIATGICEMQRATSIGAQDFYEQIKSGADDAIDKLNEAAASLS